MTITELKKLLERAESMGYGSGKVSIVEKTSTVWGTVYETRDVIGGHLIHLGTNLLSEAADPTRDDYELRLDLDRGETANA